MFETEITGIVGTMNPALQTALLCFLVVWVWRAQVAMASLTERVRAISDQVAVHDRFVRGMGKGCPVAAQFEVLRKG
jgi:hypothetical protein